MARRPGRRRESATVTTVSPASRAYASASTTSLGWRGSAKQSSALAPARTAPRRCGRRASSRPRRAAARRGGPWRRSRRSRAPARTRRAARARAAGGSAASSRPARSHRAPGRRAASARCRRFSISACTACWYSLYGSLGVPVGRLPGSGADLPQMPAQRRIAVEAERDGEAGHGRLADPGQLGELHAGQEGRVGGLPHHAVRDAPLGRREPVPLEELLQPRARAAHPVLLLWFRAAVRPVGTHVPSVAAGDGSRMPESYSLHSTVHDGMQPEQEGSARAEARGRTARLPASPALLPLLSCAQLPCHVTHCRNRLCRDRRTGWHPSPRNTPRRDTGASTTAGPARERAFLHGRPRPRADARTQRDPSDPEGTGPGVRGGADRLLPGEDRQRLETVVDQRMRRQMAEQQMVVAARQPRPQHGGSSDYPEGWAAASRRRLAGAGRAAVGHRRGQHRTGRAAGLPGAASSASTPCRPTGPGSRPSRSTGRTATGSELRRAGRWPSWEPGGWCGDRRTPVARRGGTTAVPARDARRVRAGPRPGVQRSGSRSGVPRRRSVQQCRTGVKPLFAAVTLGHQLPDAVLSRCCVT